MDPHLGVLGGQPQHHCIPLPHTRYAALHDYYSMPFPGSSPTGPWPGAPNPLTSREASPRAPLALDSPGTNMEQDLTVRPLTPAPPGTCSTATRQNLNPNPSHVPSYVTLLSRSRPLVDTLMWEHGVPSLTLMRGHPASGSTVTCATGRMHSGQPT